MLHIPIVLSEEADAAFGQRDHLDLIFSTRSTNIYAKNHYNP
uniref:Uncharacterized protein n=1 Tax=Solanum lycopersicum TaxID=4081 RepID=A0A3Q7JRF9_SOLLC